MIHFSGQLPNVCCGFLQSTTSAGVNQQSAFDFGVPTPVEDLASRVDHCNFQDEKWGQSLSAAKTKSVMVGALAWFSPVEFFCFLSILFTIKKTSCRDVGKRLYPNTQRSDSLGLRVLCCYSQTCKMRQKLLLMRNHKARTVSGIQLNGWALGVLPHDEERTTEVKPQAGCVENQR